MSTFKHILVPTDFGEPAERALDLAISLASKDEAKLTLLHSVWIPPVAYGAYAERLVRPMDELNTGAQKELDAALAARAVRRFRASPRRDRAVRSAA